MTNEDKRRAWREYARRWRALNPERAKGLYREAYERNREIIKARMRERYHRRKAERAASSPESPPQATLDAHQTPDSAAEHRSALPCLNGYRNSAFPAGALPPPDRWPSRETALALIEALEDDKARNWHELEKLTGIPDVAEVIGWCFTIYGYSALSPKAVALWLMEGSMAAPRSVKSDWSQAPEGSMPGPPKLAYGFNR